MKVELTKELIDAVMKEAYRLCSATQDERAAACLERLAFAARDAWSCLPNVDWTVLPNPLQATVRNERRTAPSKPGQFLPMDRRADASRRSTVLDAEKRERIFKAVLKGVQDEISLIGDAALVCRILSAVMREMNPEK